METPEKTRPDFGFSLPLSLFHFHDAFRTIYETSYTCLNHIFPPREGILPIPCPSWKTQLELGDIAHKNAKSNSMKCEIAGSIGRDEAVTICASV